MGVGMFVGMLIGCLLILLVFLPWLMSDSEIWHAIDHRIAEKIKGDKPDIDIDVR
jgi:hypothetical protein